MFKTVMNEFDCDSKATEVLCLVETILTTSSTVKVLFRAAILFTFSRITADFNELVCGRPLAGFSNVLTRRVFLVFITMMHTYIDYNGKMCCSFVILDADSQIFV